MANKAAGKGYEDKTYYGNIKHHFYAIENIHVMRSSLQKLMDGKRVSHSRQGNHNNLNIFHDIIDFHENEFSPCFLCF